MRASCNILWVVVLLACGAAGPAAGPAKACPCKSSKITHTVKPGDALWSIARRYDARSAEIMACTGLESDQVRPGQKLIICPGSEYRPGATSPSTPPKKSSSSSSTQGKTKITYTVKGGDVLGKIAEAHGVRVAQIKEWNGLESDAIRAGQKLVIYK